MYILEGISRGVLPQFATRGGTLVGPSKKFYIFKLSQVSLYFLNERGLTMLGTVFFIGVNVTLTVMLTALLREKDRIDLLFLLCLLFTFGGNLSGGITINTVISFVNLVLGIILFK